MARYRMVSIAMLFALLLPAMSHAGGPVATKVMVRAVAHDAKIIGTHVGGAKITIRDAATDSILTEGVQLGGTGDTELIMKKPRERGVSVYDTEGAAGFLATLMLSKPTRVEITAVGPLGTPQSTQRAAKTVLLLPGKDVLGDGIVLEIYGLTVEILEPNDGTPIAVGDEMPVRVKLTMT
jgi:hypothetical protein